MKLVTESWDNTLFYLATLSLVFIGSFLIRVIAG